MSLDSWLGVLTCAARSMRDLLVAGEGEKVWQDQENIKQELRSIALLVGVVNCRRASPLSWKMKKN